MSRFLLSACAALALSPAIASASTSLDRLQELVVGEWTSIACELRPQLNPQEPGAAPNPSYLTRDFTYDAEGGFTGVITVYADPACDVPLVAYDFSGDIVWHDANPAVEGAWSNDYVLNASLNLTPLAQPFADQMNSLPKGACGEGAYVVGEPTSLIGQGCVLLNNLQPGDVVVDYDLLYIREDTPNLLFMGGKHVSGEGFYRPENRPVVGLQQPLIRVE